MRPSGCGSSGPAIVGTDNKDQHFTIVADHAIQRSSDVPVVDIIGMSRASASQRGRF